MPATPMHEAHDAWIDNVLEAAITTRPTDTAIRIIRACVCGGDLLAPYNGGPGIGRLRARAGLRATFSLKEVHEISRCLTFRLALECNIQVRRRAQCMQQCPKSEALTTILG